MTNAERIRSMTDEELAEFLCGLISAFCNCHDKCPAGNMCCCCHNGMEDWLKKDAE